MDRVRYSFASQPIAKRPVRSKIKGASPKLYVSVLPPRPLRLGFLVWTAFSLNLLHNFQFSSPASLYQSPPSTLAQKEVKHVTVGTRGKPPTDRCCANYSTHGLYHCGTLKYGMPSQHTKAGGGQGHSGQLYRALSISF